MRKIPTLFIRDRSMFLVTADITPGYEWVISGEGIATRKYDGTACLVRLGKLYKRYDAKRGKPTPPGFEPADDPDPASTHWPGWVPVGEGPEDAWHREPFESGENWPDWTYELCGPKVQGNPERLNRHFLIRHGIQNLPDAPRDYDGLREFLRPGLIEGIVWWRNVHDQDCEKVKIKGKDFDAAFRRV